MTPTRDNAERVKLAHELRTTSRELRDRGLLVATKWATELLTALPCECRTAPYLPFSPPANQVGLSSPPRGPRPSMGDFAPSPGGLEDSLISTDGHEGGMRYGSLGVMGGAGMGGGMGMGGMGNAEAGPSRARTWHGIEVEEEDDVLEEDEFQLAKSFFDIHELDRVVHTLKGAKSPRAKFLKHYAAFLSADRKAQESLPHFLDTKQERLALFPTLNTILQELMHETEPYLVYLRGLIYQRLEQRDAAIECYVRSAHGKPYNWSCWSQLAQLIESADHFIEVKEQLPPGHMLQFFAINVMLDLHTATELVLKMITELQDVFPESVHLRAQRAMVFYHMRNFPAAEEQFDAVQKIDPFRMEEVDIYSNMLYVMGKTAKLGKIAHEYAEVDRNRPEVCCLIGNYYSSRGDHTKAITYFRRALLFNREYLPAWTLMGHEYVELKNSHAAIEAYRKAIDVNAKDYRAWYGLGQAYELLDMPMYAIEYYNQATSLRPYDCRMWTALATVYEGLGRLSDAIAAHARALLGADRSQTQGILGKLATLHTQLDHAGGRAYSPDGIAYHRKLLALGERDATPLAELADSYLAVAQWEMRPPNATRPRGEAGAGAGAGAGAEKGDLALAAQYLERIAQSNLAQRDKAAEILRELRVREARMMA